MTEVALLIGALVVFAFALISRRAAEGIITPPMLFLGLGWLLAAVGLLHADHGEPALHILAEITLVVVLFSDAAMIKSRSLRSQAAWPLRMLLIGLPLAMVLGFAVNLALLPADWPWLEVALLAAILAPTDAALGQAVISNPVVPERVRQSLTVESGANDGLALPVILMIGCFAVEGVHDNGDPSWLMFAIQQVGLGILVGAGVGAAGGLCLATAARLKLSSTGFQGIAALALAGAAYLLAVEVGANGFLATFIAGLAFGTVAHPRSHFTAEFLETEGQLLVLGTFFMVGAVLVPHAMAAIGWPELLLILASLLIARPLAIWLSLMGSRADPSTRLFLGWFGPRGLATVLFALLVLDDFALFLTHGEQILSIATLAVVISAVLHGVTAAPWARWYGRRQGNKPSTPSAAAAPVTES